MQKKLLTKRYVLTIALTIIFFTAITAQEKKPTASSPAPAVQPPVVPPANTKPGPKPYKDVITDKAITHKGLFAVHKVEDKWYFEIGDSLLGRVILVVNRISKA